MTLTVATITAAQPGQTLRDTEVPGLQLRAFPQRKSFYFYYRTKQGEERKPKLGDYPTFTLNEARRLAKQMLMEVALGKDPSGERRAARNGLTMSELADMYAEVKLPKCKSKKTRKDLETTLGYIRDGLGSMRAANIDLDDVQKFHNKLTKDRGPITANRVVSYVSALITLAIKHKARPLGSNFCQFVERNVERKRQRYLRPGDEARAVGAELRSRLYGRFHESALFIYLLLLTGARKGEIGSAKLTDRKGNALVLREHKTADSAGDKVIHLPDAAVELLDDPLRLPHTRDGYLLGVGNVDAVWRNIRDAAGCPDLRIHDLRHSFASFGLGAGLNLSTVGPLLGHANEQTTKRYAHLIDGPAKAAVNLIADNMTAALAEEKKE
jgi:integrase